MDRPVVNLLVTLRDVRGFLGKDNYVTFGLADSPETLSGKSITIGVRGDDGVTATVDVDPAVLLDTSDLILEAVNASTEN